MKKEVDIAFEVGKGAKEVMKFLENKKYTFGEALDILSMALIVSAFNADIDKAEFLNNTSIFWDGLKDEVSDNKQSGKYTH